MKRFLNVIFLMGLLSVLLPGSALGLTAYIPHITGGESNWTDYLQVDNNKSTTLSFSLTLYASGNQVYQGSFSVNGLSKRVIDLKSLASAAAETGIIHYSDPMLNFRLSYENLVGRGVAEFRLPEEQSQILAFYFSDFTPNVTWKGIAFSNFNASAASVRLYALGQGTILGNTTISVPAYQKTVGLYTEWFSGIPFSEVEKIIAVSTVSLCGITISGNQNSSLMLFTAAAPLTEFDPGTPATGCSAAVGNWAGTLTGNDVCGHPYTGNWTITVNADCSGTLSNTYSIGNPGGGTFTVSGNSVSGSGTCKNCAGLPGIATFSALFNGNTFTGTYAGCGSVDNYTGTRK